MSETQREIKIGSLVKITELYVYSGEIGLVLETIEFKNTFYVLLTSGVKQFYAKSGVELLS